MNDETSIATKKTNVSETNLVLAKIVLKTLESGQINITDHLPLFHVFESIAKSAHALSSTTTFTIRSRREDTSESRVKYDSIGSFHDSSSLPSSVHVNDVTQGIRPAQEPTASPGVSLTGDARNVIDDTSEVSVLDHSGGRHVSQFMSYSRKRSSTEICDTELSDPPLKSYRFNHEEVSLQSGVINSSRRLSEYATINSTVSREINVAHQRLVDTNPGKVLIKLSYLISVV
jgi:hypothetical protein